MIQTIISEAEFMKMRAVDFVTDGDYVFPRLNELMDVGAYDWYIDDVDMNYFYFRDGKYTGEEFLNTIYEFTKLSFVRIRRYIPGESVTDIDTYDDFQKSNCDFLILFYDGGFTEFYAKETELLSKFEDFCRHPAIKRVRFVYDEEGERTDMHF